MNKIHTPILNNSTHVSGSIPCWLGSASSGRRDETVWFRAERWTGAGCCADTHHPSGFAYRSQSHHRHTPPCSHLHRPLVIYTTLWSSTLPCSHLHRPLVIYIALWSSIPPSGHLYRPVVIFTSLWSSTLPCNHIRALRSQTTDIKAFKSLDRTRREQHEQKMPFFIILDFVSINWKENLDGGFVKSLFSFLCVLCGHST